MPSHGIARYRTVSHGIARSRTLSHAVASFGGYCEDSGGFCQNRASGGPLDKQVYSLDFLNGSREPCGAKQAPRGGRSGPPGGGDVEIATRPASGYAGPWTGAGTPRGQPGGLPTGCPHPRPPTASPSPHFHRWRPAAAIGAATLIFFQPLSGASAPARFACPLRCQTGREGEPAKPGEPRRGAPGGRRGARRADRGAARPRPLGGRITPPLGGFWRGRGSRPKGGGTPSGGAPRSAFDRAKNAALIDLRERKHESLKNQ